MAMAPPQPPQRPIPGRLMPRPRSDDFDPVQPLLGRGVMLRNYNSVNQTGIITVTMHRSNNTVNSMYCRVGPTTPALTMPPVAPPAGAVDPIQLTQDPLNLDNFSNANVPIANIPQAVVLGPNNQQVMNQQIIVGSYNAAGNLQGTTTFQFVAVPQNSTVIVLAKGCLFFAYTPAGIALPRPGEALPTNYPTSLAVPVDAAQVTASMPGAAQTWTNSGNVLSGPSGQPGDFDITSMDYITTALHSQYMKRLDGPNAPQLLDGLLASMWDIGEGNSSDPNACVEFPLGMPLTTPASTNLVTIPAAFNNATRSLLNLLLGMHQAQNWAGSNGQLTVTLTWA